MQFFLLLILLILLFQPPLSLQLLPPSLDPSFTLIISEMFSMMWIDNEESPIARHHRISKWVMQGVGENPAGSACVSQERGR